jgi:hypothetical protein
MPESRRMHLPSSCWRCGPQSVSLLLILDRSVSSSCQNNSVLQLYRVAQLDAVFCYSRPAVIVQTDFSVIFFKYCLSEMSILSAAHFPTLAENAVNTWRVRSQIIFN